MRAGVLTMGPLLARYPKSKIRVALGGGCELAMACDFILASDDAKFGQPEINVGAIPGAGGSQRMPRFIGKSKAMYAILTGDMIDANEAEKCGLIAKVFSRENFNEEVFLILR